MNENKKTELATFGAGCFWGVEDIYLQVPGVIDTAVGYMGGSKEHPTYEEVCTGRTGHVEVVQVTYDPEMVPYERLVDIFFKNHNPTTKNRQGPDVGPQYRSVVFFHSTEQEELAKEALRKEGSSGKWDDPIVTELVAASTFWRAEEYHQKYFQKKGITRTCHI